MAVTVNLGRVQPIYRGPYLASFPYRPLDFVTFEGVTYYCIKPVTGTAPPDPEFWVSILQLPLGLAAGGTGATDAEGARTALGATSVGGALFTAEDAEAARGALGASALGDALVTVEDAEAARTLLGVTALEILQTISANPFMSEPLAKPFPILDHIIGADVPDNSGTAKFIRLTAGQSGPGGYNEGLLTDEQVSGSAPLVVADAEIMFGPMAGQRVPLINTIGAIIRPSTNSGLLQFDQTQRKTGGFNIRRLVGGGEALSSIQGVFNSEGVGSSAFNSLDVGSGLAPRRIEFDTGSSPNARVSDTTDGETRMKNIGGTYYMKVVA